jgi:hypothetical protein
VALHTAYVKELDLLPYLVLTTTTGAIQLWRGDVVQWTREEGLSRLQVAQMVELPERKTIAAHIIDQDETVVERVWRQLTDVKVRFFESSTLLVFIIWLCPGVAPIYLSLCQEVRHGFLRIHPSARGASLSDSIRP